VSGHIKFRRPWDILNPDAMECGDKLNRIVSRLPFTPVAEATSAVL